MADAKLVQSLASSKERKEACHFEGVVEEEEEIEDNGSELTFSSEDDDDDDDDHLPIRHHMTKRVKDSFRKLAPPIITKRPCEEKVSQQVKEKKTKFKGWARENKHSLQAIKPAKQSKTKERDLTLKQFEKSKKKQQEYEAIEISSDDNFLVKVDGSNKKGKESSNKSKKQIGGPMWSILLA